MRAAHWHRSFLLGVGPTLLEHSRGATRCLLSDLAPRCRSCRAFRTVPWPFPVPAEVAVKIPILVSRLVLSLGIAVASTGPLVGQEHEHQHAVGQLGRVVFPVSCTAKARQGFEHAMAVLHSFWWEEGERAFGAVL